MMSSLIVVCLTFKFMHCPPNRAWMINCFVEHEQGDVKICAPTRHQAEMRAINKLPAVFVNGKLYNWFEEYPTAELEEQNRIE